MANLLSLSLGKGNLESGFSDINARLFRDGDTTKQQLIGKFTGSLPPAPHLQQIYQNWQMLYLALSEDGGWNVRMEIGSHELLQISIVDFQHLCEQLKSLLNQWLQNPEFLKIEQQMRTAFNREDEIQIMIETENEQLLRLPWHLWSFLDSYPCAEVALAAPQHHSNPNRRNTARGKVRILAILGNSDGINLAQDRKLLNYSLGEKAYIQFLNEPSRKDLTDYLWDANGWDILFFAGHGQTKDNTGCIWLNTKESLTVRELKNSLRKAINNGLYLAIFNSCDGLGLAKDLGDLSIPQIILMKEAIPDGVAQAFLTNFLKAFARGNSLYLSVRDAREQLEGMEDRFPCASWLPALFQNPAVKPLTWWELQGKKTPTKKKLLRSKVFTLVCLAITIWVIGLRYGGILQGWELKAFDHLMRLRPREAQDERVIIIKITRDDVVTQPSDERRGSLADQTLNQLLVILEQAQPRIIGLDLYRDYPVLPKYPELAEKLAQNNQLIAICKLEDVEGQKEEIFPPPEIPPTRLGFSDTVVDRDLTLRRHLLAADSAAGLCKTSYALNLKLALAYLEKENIQLKFPNHHTWQLGKAHFTVLEAHQGGYQHLDARGHQILLNYRWHGSSQWENQFEQVTLNEVLEGKVRLDYFRDRVVLIGTTDHSFTDYVRTPYLSPDGNPLEIPGVIMQAQMTSQIISAALDGRKLLWISSWWLDGLWIGVWAAVGGLVGWSVRGIFNLALVSCGVLMVLSATCWLILVFFGGWIPFVPAALALVFSLTAIKFYFHRL